MRLFIIVVIQFQWPLYRSRGRFMGHFIDGYICRSVEDPHSLDAIPPSFGFRVRRSESLSVDAIDLRGYNGRASVADPFLKYQIRAGGEDRFAMETKRLTAVCELLDSQFSAADNASLMGATP